MAIALCIAAEIGRCSTWRVIQRASRVADAVLLHAHVCDADSHDLCAGGEWLKRHWVLMRALLPTT